MQLPVWQDFYVANQANGVEVLAVAIDFQGADLPRPYIEQANPSYANAIDSENVLGVHFGFSAVPNALFIDEKGVIEYAKFGGFDIRKPEYRQLADQFASTSAQAIAQEALDADGFKHDQARTHFAQGLAFFQQGNSHDAVAEWRRGLAYEPENWIIRKQIWAIENPDKFYSGDVDFDWQREQIALNQ